MWHTFFQDINRYHHLVQMSQGVPPTTRGVRDIWLDEDLFMLFAAWCYYCKYADSAEKMSAKGTLVPPVGPT